MKKKLSKSRAARNVRKYRERKRRAGICIESGCWRMAIGTRCVKHSSSRNR